MLALNLSIFILCFAHLSIQPYFFVSAYFVTPLEENKKTWVVRDLLSLTSRNSL